MKALRNKIASLLLAFCMLATLFPASAAEYTVVPETKVSAELPQRDQFGEKLRTEESGSAADTIVPFGSLALHLSDTGVLTITGTGIINPSDLSSVNKAGITAVVIADGITGINNHAFSGFAAMQSITIADSVTFIGSDVFADCASLTYLKLPANLENLDVYLLRGSSLVTIELNDKIRNVHEFFFDGVTTLSNIIVPEGNPYLESVDGVLFNERMTILYRYPEGKADISYTVPNTVFTIRNSAFYCNEYLTSVTLPASLRVIEQYAFMNCLNLTSAPLTDKLQFIGPFAFSNTNLSSVTIPAATIEVGYSAFGRCFNLSAINVAPGNEYYRAVDGILYYCIDDLLIGLITYPAGKTGSSFMVPESVNFIEDYAFNGCYDIIDLSAYTTHLSRIGEYALYDTEWYRSQNDEFVLLGNCLVKYNGEGGDVVIPDDVFSITHGVFSGNDTLTSITMPDSVCSVGEYAFSECYTLAWEDIHWSDNLHRIGAYTFAFAENLTSVQIPDSVIYIGNNAFYGCPNLTDVTISSALSIQSYAFALCQALERVSLPDGLLFIGSYAFYGCTALESVTIPDSVECIESYAFAFCYNLNSVTLPRNLTYAGSYCFTSCDSLTSVVLPDSLTYIPYGMFSSCMYLTNVTLGQNIEYIEGDAFYNCNYLESIVIPDSVKWIGEYAFCYCYSLSSLDLGSNVGRIGYYAFACTDLNEVTFPETLNTIEYGAFYALHEDGNFIFHFKGDAPTIESDVFPANATLYYNPNASGWTTPQWNGYAAYPESASPALNGLVMDANGTWWYYVNGVVQTGYTGLIYFNEAFFYVENGALNAGYTGLVYFDGIFYYVEGGVLKTDYTGLVYLAGVFYYVENGVLNFGYTGLIYCGDAFYYVENGILNFGYTGLVYFADNFYYVENGVLNWGFTGLIYCGELFYYVKNGVLDWSYTGLFLFYGVWYYVNGGILDFGYNGIAYTPDGTQYNVIGGIAQP